MHAKTHAKLDDQLCFALYAASRAVMSAYRARLTKLGVTYPQYLTMLAVWEKDGSTVRELGKALDLDSGTLSPILKRLEQSGYIRRDRSELDERAVHVLVTAKGLALESTVAKVREDVEKSTGLTDEEFHALRNSLHTLKETVQASL